MGLIKEGIDKIKCGIGIHQYDSIPDEFTALDYLKPGHPHSLTYVHICLRCKHRRISYYDMRIGETQYNELGERIKK